MILGHIDEHGIYHRGEAKKMGEDRNTMHKQWDHEIQRHQFAKEIIQPHVGDKANSEFVKAYPEYSQKYFTQAERDAAVRETP